jgi:quinol-cytochrome oxidoreductase complex cytochrome b subunit
MNCHGNHDNNNQGKKQRGHLSHMLMMLICCGIPVIILFLVPFLIKNGGSAVAKPLAFIAPFICPIMMIFMLPMMFKGNHGRAKKD